MTRRRLPDFFIIGAMKAATSSLHDQLAALDGVVMSDPKELYFFSDDPVFARGLDWYASHFAGAGPDDLCGESTTHYTKLPTHPHTVDRIAEVVPDARFVYVMRHPVDRLISQYTHMWLEREVTVPFSDAIDGAVPELLDYSRYALQLLPYLERFGADRVLPLFFDRMHAEPDETLQRVADHIGLERAVRWNHDVQANNISSERLRTSEARDRIKMVPGYDRVRSLVPERAVERIRRRWRPSERPEPSPAQMARIAAELEPELGHVGRWLGVDLDLASFRDVTAARPLDWTDETRQRHPVPEAAP